MGTLYITNKNGNMFSDNFYEDDGAGGGMKWPFKKKPETDTLVGPGVEPVASSQNIQVINKCSRTLTTSLNATLFP